MGSAEFALLAVPRGCIDFAGGFALGRLAGDGETYLSPRTTSPGGASPFCPAKLNHLNPAGVTCLARLLGVKLCSPRMTRLLQFWKCAV